MILINCTFLKNLKCIDVIDSFIDTASLNFFISKKSGIAEDSFLTYCNGRRLLPGQNIRNGSSVRLVLALPGGKGGFGSMLRAIGAQIEKTTNREACRDLSGRRLRDINEEQRLKRWISKKAEREAEAEGRQKARLEKLKSKPKHEFHDIEYDKQRSELPERIDNALTEGLQKIPCVLRKKRTTDADCDQGPSKKNPCLWFGVEGLSSSEENDSEKDEELHYSNVTTDQTLTTPAERGEQQDCEPFRGQIDESQNLVPCEGTRDIDAVFQLSNKNDESNDQQKFSHDFQETNINEHQRGSLLDPLPETESTTNGENEKDCFVDLLSFDDLKELELLGLEKLKSILTCLGLKCGGTIAERAQRLWSIRGLEKHEYPSSLRAKQKKKESILEITKHLEKNI